MRSLPQDSLVVKIISFAVEDIDKSYPWGYFDGSSAGEPKICGARGMIYIANEHFFSFKAGLGIGSNNFVEICALKLLLTLAKEKNIVKIQLFGDSQLVINWANGKFRLLNLELSQVLNEVNRLSDMFEHLDLKHIYRERNSHADVLAKVGVSVMDGCWFIKEYRASDYIERYQLF